MIPKKIHYCWFGYNPLSERAKQCIESWKKFCPDYEIIQWDESNYDINKNSYVRRAYHSRKWAFLTDYVRLDVISQEGGIYLDTDVELIKNLDNLLNNVCYMGMEEVGTVNTGLGFGAEAGHPFIFENKDIYEKNDYVKNGVFKPEICVRLTTKLLQSKGLVAENKIQRFDDITIYPTEYFCPLKMGTKKLCITENTFSIHHYEASWYTGNVLIRKIKYRLIPVKLFIKKFVLKKKE